MGFGVTSFSFKKEVTKKVNPAVPSGASPASLRPFMAVGDFCSANLLHLRGIYPTPQMGWLGKSFCFPVLLQIPSITGEEAGTDTICKSIVRATPVFASFFNLQTQNLKLPAFAPQSEKSVIFRGALRESKGH